MSAQTHPLLDVSRDEIIPYFMWDYGYTVGQIKDILAHGSEAERLWMMAKILRDARYEDVWKFITLEDFLKYRKALIPRLGRQRPFWEFLYSRWVKQGIVSDDNPAHSATE